MPRGSSSRPKYALSKKIKVGVLCGGSSSERSISLRSGRAVYKALKTVGFQTRLIDPKNKRHLNRSLRGLDVIFIALHGRGGEDGVLQAQLQKKRYPFIGSDARACARTFNKVRAKKIFAKKRIPTPPHCVVNRKNWKKRLQRFETPFFAKPSQEGSSIGAFSVEDFSKSAEIIKKRLALYGELLIERKMQGREFTVGILAGKALPVIELRPKRSFYDFKSKYTKGLTQYLLPAPVSRRFAKKLQKIALKTHHSLGLRDLSRVDFMTDLKGKPFVLEANTIPGFTELSLLPKAAKKKGISFQSLCYQLVEAAWRRKTK